MNNESLKTIYFRRQKHIDTATIEDFYQWACAGEMPNGKADVSIINPEDCEGLLDNGWFDNFDDSDPKKKLVKKLQNFLRRIGMKILK